MSLLLEMLGLEHMLERLFDDMITLWLLDDF